MPAIRFPTPRRLLGLACAGLLAVAGGASVSAEDGKSYDETIAELQSLIAEPRETDVFELDFQVMDLDRILVVDNFGDEHVFHYMTFRLRNRVSDNAEYLMEHATVYNEILDQMVEEFASVRKETEGGASLVVTDVEALEDQRLATILEREDLKVKTRKVNLTVIGFDEYGTRFRLFDPVPGEGPQEAFEFDDRGVVVANSDFSQVVREAIEERERQRLYTVHEIRNLELPPYQAGAPSTFEDGYGMSQGEVYGVIIFNRLNVHGNQFNFHIQGLSNKLRFQWPEVLPAGKVEDYFNLDVLRRTYVLTASRPGDEYFRDRDQLSINFQGWRWVKTFQRLEQRATIAYARYHLNNIRLAQEQSTQIQYTWDDGSGAMEPQTETTDGPVLHDSGVAEEAWDRYGMTRSTWPDRYLAKIEAQAAYGETVLAPYGEPAEAERVTPTELERLADERRAWDAVLRQYRQVLEARRDALDDDLPTREAITNYKD